MLARTADHVRATSSFSRDNDKATGEKMKVVGDMVRDGERRGREEFSRVCDKD